MRSQFGFFQPAILLAIVGGLLFAPSTLLAQKGFPLIDHKWRLYTSPHFEVFSRNHDRPTRELVRALEVSHAYFQHLFPDRARERLGVKVFHFAQTGEFKAYAPEGMGERTVGSFVPGKDRDIILLSASDASGVSLEIIKWQYVRQRFSRDSQQVPAWLPTGVGFLFSTLQATAGELVLGRPDDYRMQVLGDLHEPFSCEALFFERGALGGALFDAHAWLFVHFLLVGQTAIPRERVEHFLREVSRGAGGPRATAEERHRVYEDLLGVAIPELSRRVDRYRQQRNFRSVRLPLPPLPDAERYAVRKVAREEIGFELMDLVLRTQRSGEARLALLHAAGEENPRAWEALGADALRDFHFDLARERWHRAVAAGSLNPRVIEQLAIQERGTVAGRYEPHFRLLPERAQLLRQLYGRAVEVGIREPWIFEQLAWVEAAAPEPDSAVADRVQEALPGLRGAGDAWIALAALHLRLDRPDAAQEILERELEPRIGRQVEAKVRAYWERRRLVGG